MIDQDFEVVKIPLTVITPWPCKGLFDVRMLALCFTHSYPDDWPFELYLEGIKNVGKLCSKVLSLSRLVKIERQSRTGSWK